MVMFLPQLVILYVASSLKVLSQSIIVIILMVRFLIQTSHGFETSLFVLRQCNCAIVELHRKQIQFENQNKSRKNMEWIEKTNSYWVGRFWVAMQKKFWLKHETWVLLWFWSLRRYELSWKWHLCYGCWGDSAANWPLEENILEMSNNRNTFTMENGKKCHKGGRGPPFNGKSH